MRFTGQVRVPEDRPSGRSRDHPGGGGPDRSLSRRGIARPLVAFRRPCGASGLRAFSLSLGGEEITFIADEPVDFAYKGVDHMAEVWARYKSMTIPRRVVAVGRSRRGTSLANPGAARGDVDEPDTAGRGASRRPPWRRP